MSNTYGLPLGGAGDTQVQLYKKNSFCLASLPFPDPLTREGRLSAGFFCLHPLAFPGYWLLQFQAWDL